MCKKNLYINLSCNIYNNKLYLNLSENIRKSMRKELKIISRAILYFMYLYVCKERKFLSIIELKMISRKLTYKTFVF